MHVSSRIQLGAYNSVLNEYFQVVKSQNVFYDTEPCFIPCSIVTVMN